MAAAASPRWRKIASDLWGNRTRTLLVVLSIAVGVFAVGMIAGSRVILTRDLRAQYWASSPSSGTIYTIDAFDDDLVDVIRHMRSVQDAEGRRTVTVRYRTGPGQWGTLQLIAIGDYDDIRVNKIRSKGGGAWPPPERAMLVEQSSLAALKAPVGGQVLIETPDGTRRWIRVAGVVHDLSQFPTFFTRTAYGYITFDTLEIVGEPRGYNQVNFIVRDRPLDKAHVQAVAALVRDKIEKSERTVAFTLVLNPGKHWSDDGLRAMLLILGVLGMLALLLSGFLVVNTISALLTQQIRQIGIMKAIGGRARQIMAMYLSTVVIFGVLALIVAVPLGILGAQGLSGYTARLLNFDVGGYTLPPAVLAEEIAAGLIVPLLAALYPVLAGTRITVRAAITAYGLGEEGPRRGVIDRLLERVRGLSRPLLLALRNTFRRKGRLALTLSTLTLAGGIFIGIMSVRDSLMATLADAFKYWNYDVQVEFDRAYRVEQLEREALTIPGIVRAESWAFRSVHRLRADDTESDTIFLIALPAATDMLQPTVLQGRWLLPADENAVVINTDLLKNEPDIGVGDRITLKHAGRKLRWRVVGIVRGVLSGPFAYANYPYAAAAMRAVGRAERVQVVTDRHDAAFQSQVAQALEAQFRRLGLRLSAVQTIADLRRQIASQFNVIIVFLMVMAVLLAVVGSLGLMGTMSINVLERTREIGVMRAIGASDGAVFRIILGEGVLIGILSWVLGIVLALPLGKVLSDRVGITFLNSLPTFRFSWGGGVLWLGLVIILAAVASFLPAWNASRLTVRDVLAYE